MRCNDREIANQCNFCPGIDNPATGCQRDCKYDDSTKLCYKKGILIQYLKKSYHINKKRIKETPDQFILISLLFIEISLRGLHHVSKLGDLRNSLKSNWMDCEPGSFISGFRLAANTYAGLTGIEAICRYKDGSESG